MDKMESSSQLQTQRSSNPANASLLRQCPNCRRHHWVRNRSRDFCSDWCADTFYNKYVRGGRQKKLTSQSDISSGNLVTSATYNAPVIEINQKQLYAYRPLPLEILDRLTIDPKGTKYLVKNLVNSGFDFSKYTHRVKLHNTPSGMEAYCLSFHNYWLFWTNNDSVLIYKYT